MFIRCPFSQENRSALVHAALTLIQAWIADGRPLHETRLGSFEKWSEVMGGVLEVAGIPGFLGNLNELYEASDSDGQTWREFTGAWWEAYREEPKKVGDLTQFCEERDLMLTVRGDGSARSQQTRLGKALGTKRDRVFNGLTIKRISQGERKHGVFYALAPSTGVPPNGPNRRDPDLLDLLEGNVGEAEGNVGDKRSLSLDPIDPITSRDLGNVGNLGNLFPSSREEKNECAAHAERENVIGDGGKIRPNVPHVPLKSATGTKYVTSEGERSTINVPLTFPRGSPADGPGEIDLATLTDVDGAKPP